MSGAVIKQGYLTKSPSDPRSSVKSWRKRWVVLYESHLLKYFKDETTYQKNGAQKGDINLNDCIEIDLNVRTRRNRDSTFVIKTNARTYYFVAESASEMKSWVDAVSRLSGLSPVSQQTGGLQSATTLESVANLSTETNSTVQTKQRAHTEPLNRAGATEPSDTAGAYFLVGQVHPEQEQANIDSSQPLPISSAERGGSHLPISQSYDSVPPVAAWQTAPGSDYSTLNRPINSFQQQSEYGTSALPQNQSSWSQGMSAHREHAPGSLYHLVPPPRPVHLGSSMTLPNVLPGGLNDRSRPFKRYDHPPGSSATDVYSVPPFAKDELYMTPRKNGKMTPPMPVVPPHIDRSNKPGDSPPGPHIDRSLKPGSQPERPLSAGSWKEHDVLFAQGKQRPIQYTQVDFVHSPTSQMGPQKAKTQYCKIDLLETMRRHVSGNDSQAFQYQHGVDPHRDPFNSDVELSPMGSYVHMHDALPPEDVGGVEEYIPMKNGVLGEYYTYMQNQDVDPDQLYLAVGNDGRYFQEDPYGVMLPPGQNGAPVNSIKTYYEL